MKCPFINYVIAATVNSTSLLNNYLCKEKILPLRLNNNTLFKCMHV